MRRKLLITFLIAALLVGGSVFAYRQWRLRSVPNAAWRCLRHPLQMVLYSIHPDEPESALDGAQLFHGYRILGQVAVTAPADQQRVAEVIHRGVLDFPDPSACFNPHHALHISDGQDTYDLVICFDCGAMEFFGGDNQAGGTAIGGPPDVLNSILIKAGVPLADPHEH